MVSYGYFQFGTLVITGGSPPFTGRLPGKAFAEPNAVWPHRNGPLWTLVTIVLILTPVQGVP